MKRARRPSPQSLPAPLGRALLNLAALVALGGAALPVAAQAIEYRSAVAGALLRERPAAEVEPQFRLRPGTPVEVVVREDGWVRVRDPALARRAGSPSCTSTFSSTRHCRMADAREPQRSPGSFSASKTTMSRQRRCTKATNPRLSPAWAPSDKLTNAPSA